MRTEINNGQPASFFPGRRQSREAKDGREAMQTERLRKNKAVPFWVSRIVAPHMWDLSSPISDQTTSPALGGRFLTTGPLGKSF